MKAWIAAQPAYLDPTRPVWLPETDARARVGRCTRTLYRWRRAGLVQARGRGAARTYLAAELDAAARVAAANAQATRFVKAG